MASKRALELPSDEPRMYAPTAGGSLGAQGNVFGEMLREQSKALDDNMKVKQRVAELEKQLEAAKAELRANEEFTVATPPRASIHGSDDIGADEMVKSSGNTPVAKPPGMDEDGEPQDEPGQSSKHDPMQDEENDDWAKAKGGTKGGEEGAPSWVWEMIVQQTDMMKEMQKQIQALQIPKGTAEAEPPNAPRLAATMVSENSANRPLAPVDRKTIEKLPKYDGAPSKFPDFAENFMDYLCTQDERWRALLECIVSHKTPIDEQGVLNIAVEANVVSQVVEFGKQLHAYLKAFTTGTAYRHVTGAGREKIFEVWRQFNEVGRS